MFFTSQVKALYLYLPVLRFARPQTLLKMATGPYYLCIDQIDASTYPPGNPLMVKFQAPGRRSPVTCPAIWKDLSSNVSAFGTRKNSFLLIFSFNLIAVIFSLIRQFLNVY